MQARPHDWSRDADRRNFSFLLNCAESHKSVFGQESPMKTAISSLDLDAPPQRNFNLPLKTLGGWHGPITSSDPTGEFNKRLHEKLSAAVPHRYPDGFRELRPLHLEMDRILTASEAEPSPDKAIVLIHGLARSRSSMDSMAKYLEANTEAQIVNFSYASTRGTLSDHAKALHHMLQHLQGVQESLLFVTALAIMVRRMLDQESPLNYSRFSRMVMLGPPNLLHNWRDVFKRTFTQSGLGQEREATGPKLGSCRNGIGHPRFRICNCGGQGIQIQQSSFKVKTT